MEEYTVKVYSDRVEWFQDGKLHRIDGPAIEWFDGDEHWFQKGKYHRIDGPAIEDANGYKCWYLQGKRVTESEVMSPSQSGEGKVVEVDGVKYTLIRHSSNRDVKTTFPHNVTDGDWPGY